MTALKKGMIIVVDFDQKKGSVTGQFRSCVVVSNTIY